MSRKILRACAGVFVAVSVGACEMTKSENPLGPTVAGPIPGVNITSPTPLEPAQIGEKVLHQCDHLLAAPSRRMRRDPAAGGAP